MNADRLLALYENVAEAHDAIARLRRFVLDLAVRGKLVGQDPADEPASELLKRIAAEKTELVKAGEIKKSKPISLSDKVSAEIPSEWVLVPLGEVILKHLGGGTPSKSNERYWNGELHWASVKDVGKSKYLDDTIDRITEEGLADSSSNLIEPGNLILVTRMGLGKLSINRIPVAINQDLRALFLSQHVSIEYAYNFFLTYGFEGAGLTVKGIKLKELLSIAFPLPPLAEQKRIVLKVEELMALLDQLDAARTEREATRDRLTTASLARLTAPDTDPGDFPRHCRFALDALPALTARPDQIKSLRQTILNLAVRGNLVESAGGELATVGDYRKLQNGYAFKSGWFAKSGMRLLRNANIGHGEIRWDETVYLPEDRVEEFERFRLRKGDIVLTLDRPFIVTGTKVARVKDADMPSLLLQRVGRFIEISEGLADDYLFLWINSPHFNIQIDPGRSNGVPHISSKQVEVAQIYVPSLAEQHRIVAKTDALMTLCDRLKAALTAAETTRARLLEALLHEALSFSGGVTKAA